MARKNGFGKMLFVGAVAAAVGGVAAYLRRQQIEGVVQDIADALDAREEDGFCSGDRGEEPVFHKVPMDGQEEQEAAQSAQGTAQPAQEAAEDPEEPKESDFVDGGEAAPEA